MLMKYLSHILFLTLMLTALAGCNAEPAVIDRAPIEPDSVTVDHTVPEPPTDTDGGTDSEDDLL